MSEDKRADLIQGLRELAQFYEDHPDVPLPPYPSLDHCVLASDDEAGIAEVQRLAEALGVPVQRDLHVRARRTFAGLPFNAYYVLREVARRHAAYATYSGAVEPEGDEP